MFKTVKFKIHNPSGRKRRMMLAAMKHATEDYKLMLDILSDNIEDMRQGAIYESVNKKTGEIRASYSDQSLQKYLRKVIESNQDRFQLKGVLRESLIADISMTMLSYLELTDSDKQDTTNFPNVPTDVKAAFNKSLHDLSLLANDQEQENQLRDELSRFSRDRIRPLSFGRFRDFQILKTSDGNKLYCVLYVGETEKPTMFPDNLIDIKTGKVFRAITKTRQTRILLQLEMGRWHLHQYFGKGEPKTAKVTYDKDTDDFYVHYSFSFEGSKIEPESIMGIDRGRVKIAAYSIIDFYNRIICTGDAASKDLYDTLNSMDQQIRLRQEKGVKTNDIWRKWKRVVDNKLHEIANEIISVAKEHRAAIVFENLSNITKTRKRTKFQPKSNLYKGLKKSQYKRLIQYVAYKAEYEGLRVYPEIHPAYTSLTCPVCGHNDKANRLDQETFVCQNCGREENADINAGANIAIIANWAFRNKGKKSKSKTFQKFIVNQRSLTEKTSPLTG